VFRSTASVINFFQGKETRRINNTRDSLLCTLRTMFDFNPHASKVCVT